MSYLLVGRKNTENRNWSHHKNFKRYDLWLTKEKEKVDQ